ncbi:MAG TPA: hypothetical protein VMC85_18100 [Desulfomonilaceae bacterium]|nr:hypothetical protein [Desulfomonilaceae bacterium]
MCASSLGVPANSFHNTYYWGHVVAEVLKEDEEPFEERMQRLTALLQDQRAEAARLDKTIWTNLKELGYGGR